jgi:hypothetical protein
MLLPEDKGESIATTAAALAGTQLGVLGFRLRLSQRRHFAFSGDTTDSILSASRGCGSAALA